jgi:hypothetical protein
MELPPLSAPEEALDRGAEPNHDGPTPEVVGPAADPEKEEHPAVRPGTVTAVRQDPAWSQHAASLDADEVELEVGL